MQALIESRCKQVGGVTGKGFTKGRSGNPGGRPKSVAEVQEAARAYTATALAQLAEIAVNGTSESARVAACLALLDRGWGKAAQAVSFDDADKYSTPPQLVVVRLGEGIEATPPRS